VAVEQIQPKGFGCCRLKVIPNAQSSTLRSFLLEHVEPGSTLITDGLSSSPGAAGVDYAHKPTPVKGSGMKGHELLPGVHRVASLVKRWLLGTHQGSVKEDHLQAYLHEFTFRFNRRHSRARGTLFYRLLQQAVETAPTSFKDLVVSPNPRVDNKPMPPKERRTAPLSLHMAVLPRPWR
jgi:transposase-like protein